MTDTQKSILEVLDEWYTPRQIADRVNAVNPRHNLGSGAAARSLRTLMDAGLVEQKQVGWFNKKRGIALFSYRARPGNVTDLMIDYSLDAVRDQFTTQEDPAPAPQASKPE